MLPPKATPYYTYTRSSGTDSSQTLADIPFQQFYSDTLLLKLIDTAIRVNPDLHIIEQRIEAARINTSMAYKNLLPSVNGVVSAGLDRYGFYTMNGVGNYDLNKSNNITPDMKVPNPVPDLFVGFRAQWEIDAWGKLRLMRKSAQQRYLASLEGRNLLITQLVAEIANLYYELQALYYELEVIKKNIELQSNELTIVVAQKEAGRATQMAVHQFEAQIFNTKALEFLLRQHIVLVENQLNFLLGRHPQPINLGINLMSQSLPSQLKFGVPANLLSRRPDMRMAEFMLQAAMADVEAARKMFYPSITLNPYVGFNAFTPAQLLNVTSLAAGALGAATAPVFQQGRIKGQYQIANTAQIEALYQYQKTLLQCVNEVVAEIKGIEFLQEAFALKEKELQQLRRALATSRDLYVAGYANYLEIITAQRGVLDAELSLVTLKKDLFQAHIRLYKSLGGGWR
ncbi:MAG TPA: TolC family protein [Phnomibacter sp.]|nr:TolC family protein [Phnomibacter sp.]